MIFDGIDVDTICDEDYANSLPYHTNGLLSTVEDTLNAWQKVLGYLNDSGTSLQISQNEGPCVNVY